MNSSSGGPNDLSNFGRGGENPGLESKSALFQCTQFQTLPLKVGSEGSSSISRTSTSTGLSNGKRCILVSAHILQSERMRRERQAEGWVAAWKDGPEQPVVKDRRSLTGADADTSATALHHLPFTGRAGHGSLRQGASLPPHLPPALPPCFPPSGITHTHTHAEQERSASQK